MAAENGLYLSYTGNNVGRPTKGAAKALLGRVYLTRNDFQKAETKLQEVTTMGYALLPNYNDLFDSKDLRKDITVGVRGGFYDADSVFIKLPSNTNPDR